MTLYIKCIDNNLEELYKEYLNDRNNSYDKSASGFNTICVNEQVIPANSFGNLVKLGKNLADIKKPLTIFIVSG